MQKGSLLVISGPAGTGKGTVISKVLELSDNFKLSVSATTRKPRSSEKDGVNYFFLDEEKFMQMVKKGEFLEHAYVHGNYYGTPIKYINETLALGQDVILEIDVQGAKNIKKIAPNAITVFIAPPSMAEMERRLRDRKTEEEDEILKRLETAKTEIEQIFNYDYMVVNDTVELCAKKIIKIAAAVKFKVKYNLRAIKKLMSGGEIE